MSFTCGFFNSQDGDRQYFNEDLSNFLEGLIEDGIYAFIDDQMRVKATDTPSMTVNVSRGRAWFNSTWTKIDAAYGVTIDPADNITSRIDALCLTVNHDRSVRNNYIEVIKGTGDVTSPQKPVVEDEPNIFRHVLCYISVPASCTAITQAQIEDRIGMDTALFTTPKWGGVPSTEDMVAQWQAQFDEFMDHIHETFDYDAAGNLQVGVENLAPDIGDVTSNDLYALDHNVLKKKVEGNWSTTKISAEIMDMKSTFQDGVDAVYEAVRAIGLTPASSTPEAIAEAIRTILNADATAGEILYGKKAYSQLQMLTGTMPNRGNVGTNNINPNGSYTIQPGYYAGGTVKANANSGTYTFPANDTGGTKDLGVANLYRYVNAGNVYSKGYADGAAWHRAAINGYLDIIIAKSSEVNGRSSDKLGEKWYTVDYNYVHNRTVNTDVADSITKCAYNIKNT